MNKVYVEFYLSNRDERDAYLKEGEEKFEELRRASREANPQLYKKLEEARQQVTRSRP